MAVELELVCSTPDGGSTAVLVTMHDRTLVGELRLALEAHLGVAAGQLHAGFAPLPDTARITTPGLVHGAALVQGAAVGLGHPVRPVTSADAPLVASGERELAVMGGLCCGTATPLTPGVRLRVGRRDDADLVLVDPETSREHARVSMTYDGTVRVADAGSRNGIRRGGWALADDTEIAVGDLLGLGETAVGVRDRIVADADTSFGTNGFLQFHRSQRTHPPGAGLDPSAVVALACGPSARVWERRRGDPDFLVTRLGLADRPPTWAVPVVVELADCGILGIASTPRPALLAAARAVVLQAAVLHAPDQLRIVVVSGPDCARDWEWASWLPHTRPLEGVIDCRRAFAIDSEQVRVRLTELRGLVQARRAGGGATRDADSAVLVVLDGTRRLRGLPELTELFATGPQVGVRALCLDAELAALPVECRTTLVTSTPLGTRAVLRRPDAPPVPDVLVDGLTHHPAAMAARALAPLRLSRNAGGDAPAPSSVRFTELARLSGVTESDATLVLRRWTASPNARCSAAVLGVGPRGPVTIDLLSDGPHALIAGASGTGKSESLVTLTASLALANSPDALTFVLLNHNKSAAFTACADLPHCTGLATGVPTIRTLDSLSAELNRRSALLAKADATNIDDYRIRTGVRLPRLVIVVDELDSLAEDIPEFLSCVARIGIHGHHLGAHLVLATRRASEVLTADLRANLNLRICLWVRQETESRDVVAAPDAVYLPPHRPGQALLRIGNSDLMSFQVARIGGPHGGPSEPVVVQQRLVTKLGQRVPPTSDGVTAAVRTDLSTVVAAISAAFRRADVDPPRVPNLAPTATGVSA